MNLEPYIQECTRMSELIKTEKRNMRSIEIAIWAKSSRSNIAKADFAHIVAIFAPTQFQI